MKSKFRILLAAAAVAAGVMSFAVSAAPAWAAKYRIGFAVGDVGNPFHTRVWKTAQNVAKAHDVDLVILDTKRDLNTEANNIDQLIAQKVDLSW